jgi:hypothetical protein
LSVVGKRKVHFLQKNKITKSAMASPVPLFRKTNPIKTKASSTSELEAGLVELHLHHASASASAPRIIHYPHTNTTLKLGETGY